MKHSKTGYFCMWQGSAPTSLWGFPFNLIGRGLN